MTYAYRFKVNEKKYPEVLRKLQDEKGEKDGGKGNGIAFYITQLILNDIKGENPAKSNKIVQAAPKTQQEPVTNVEVQVENTTKVEQNVEKEVKLDEDDTIGISL